MEYLDNNKVSQRGSGKSVTVTKYPDPNVT